MKTFSDPFRAACWSMIILVAAMRAPAQETQIQYLSGHGSDDAVMWGFFCTGGRNSGEWKKIPVPSCWELQGFGTYDYGYEHRNDKGTSLAREQGKYRLAFTVPAAWQGRVVRLVFDGAMTDTEATLNGSSVGAMHQGSFYRFKYDVTSLLKPGAANLLEVTVGKLSANESVNNAERLGDYWNFGGIFRPVYLEALPAQSIDRVAIDARADGSFLAEVYLNPGAAGQVTAQIVDAKDGPVGAPFAAEVPAGETKVLLRTQVKQPALWTAETPHLYRVRLILAQDGATHHVVTQRFGFRTFEVRPRDGLYLNGQKIILKGVNRHSFWPESGRALSRQICFDDARLIKEANMNAVRMSHYPPDADFLEACDELGLYVLDELAGWHGWYDTPTGARLIGEMVRRDVNHPSILFWDNGNEGGWNRENDGEFAKWDVQQRRVLHPWELFSDVNTVHYKGYAQTQKFLAGPEIYLPTEMNHALYDGGGGAWLWDRWELMRKSTLSAGAFIWALLDEAVVRTDENGRLDARANLAPDGIVGPHREKEGSFYTVREIWSPVVIPAENLPEDFTGVLPVENRYDFTALDQCTFEWSLARFAEPGKGRTGHAVISSGGLKGPPVAPHAAGVLKLALPDAWRTANALFITARNPEGRELWTWSWKIPPAADPLLSRAEAKGRVTSREDAANIVVQAGSLELRFSRESGWLVGASHAGKPISLANGPRFLAYKRKAHDFEDVAPATTLTGLAARNEGMDVIIEASYAGPLQHVRWKVSPGGRVALDYDYDFAGEVDLLGVTFDYPEAKVKAKRWLGVGPYRVWQNRLKGGHLDVWRTEYNDTIPGETWIYPEFKGYFRDWQWIALETTEGVITLGNESPGAFAGIFAPRDGRVGPLLNLPSTGLALLDVIPAIGEKFNLPEALGPQSQPRKVTGTHHGAVVFRFDAP